MQHATTMSDWDYCIRTLLDEITVLVHDIGAPPAAGRVTFDILVLWIVLSAIGYDVPTALGDDLAQLIYERFPPSPHAEVN